jgi:probable rRNA maturation factor
MYSTPKSSVIVASNLWLGICQASQWIEIAEQCVSAVFREIAWAYESDVSLVLADDLYIQKLNKKYRKKDVPTNVLSFPQILFEKPAVLPKNAEETLLGDVVLSFETVLKESMQFGLHFLEHVSHLVVHGVLHLFGFDHVTSSDREVMETLEISILSRLGFENPYV